jgi:beta-galactosidase
MPEGKRQGSLMKPVEWTSEGYRIDGRPVYLNSGEFHYFRVPREDWRRRLELFKEAGGNAVATYIPWGLHEPTEGDIRFGDTDVRDLEAFLQLCRELELYVTARPGPYQYSELRYDGLPGWLCDDYPELRARDIDGKDFRNSSVSYLHPLFLEKAKVWFQAVCPIIARHTLSRGGAVAYVQFDNELMGIHEWFGSWDFHPVTMGFGAADGRYPGFLKEKYGSVSAMNAAYGTNWQDFSEARPLAMTTGGTVEQRRRVKDYQDFYFRCAAEYAGLLVDWMWEAGIDCDIVHNSANPYMNSYFLETVEAMKRKGARFILGSDHYYNLDMDWDQNNPTPKYATKVFYSNEMLRSLGFPPSVYELPGGSKSHWPPIAVEDLACCYLTNVAFGMKGHNYYIFTGGPNPEGLGNETDIYDFGAGIGPAGEIRPVYGVEKHFGLFMREHAWLAAAERVADFHLALDWNHSRSKYFHSAPDETGFSNMAAWSFFRKGMMISSLCASYNMNLLSLHDEDLTAQTGKPLWVATSACMGADVQERLVRFVRNGGRLLLCPLIPHLDEDLRPCTILRDFLGGATSERYSRSYPCANVGPVHNVQNQGLWQSGIRPEGAVTFATDERSGAEIGWHLTLPGGGQVHWLGVHWMHTQREHAQMVAALLTAMGCGQPVVQCSNDCIWTSLRSDGENSMLFAMNLFSSPREAAIRVRRNDGTHFETGLQKFSPMQVKTCLIGSEG